jgi:hypothetical protein
MKGQNTAAKYTVAIEVARPPADIFNHVIHDVSKFWPEEFREIAASSMMNLYSGQETAIIQKISC